MTQGGLQSLWHLDNDLHQTDLVAFHVKHADLQWPTQTFGHEPPWPLDLDGHSVKHPKAKPKVQTFGHEVPWPLDLNGHSVKEHATIIGLKGTIVWNLHESELEPR
jgi:hypothetical protein